MTDIITRSVDRLYAFRRPILLLLQVLLIVASNQLAFWLRFDGEVPLIQQPYDVTLLPLLLAVRLAVFFPLRLHQGVWRYASIWDLRNIVVAVLASSVMFWAVTHLLLGITQYPRSVFIIDAILLILLIGGVRLSRRIYLASSRNAKGRKILIYGAGDAGEMIVRDLLQSSGTTFSPIGFIDDDTRKIGQRIHGIPVLGTREMLPRIFDDFGPDELLIAIPSASPQVLRGILRALEPHKVRITTLPRIHQLIGEQVKVGQIRQLKVEDLLAREPIGLDYAPVKKFLEGKRVLVTGAGGSIGSELCRQIAAAQPAALYLLDRYENGLFQIHRELTNTFPMMKLVPLIADVTDAKRVSQVMDCAKPHQIFHAAAHKHVPLMEDNPCEAVKNNVRGTRLMAEAAVSHGVEKFVLISTDKAVNPTSIMGASKRAAELVLQGMHRQHRQRFATVRFGNVLASNGSVVPTFLEQVARGGPVTVTHPEMRRFFMLIPEAVQLVLHAGALNEGGPLFVLEMGEQVKVADMARDLIRLSGLIPDKDIEIHYTGIRPGEKLFEELIGFDEEAGPSPLTKVLSVRPRLVDSQFDASEMIGSLEALALEGRNEELVQRLMQLVSGKRNAASQSTVA